MSFMDKMKSFEESNRIPEHMLEGIERYIEHRIPPGSFLMAALSNDMMEALSRADITNRYLLWEYGFIFYNCLPLGSYGSPKAVSEWLEGSANG